MHGTRPRRVLGLCGVVRFRRPYYYCRPCGKGFCPFDGRAGLGPRGLSRAAQQLATLAGAACESFARAAGLLQEMAGIRLSESTVERATEEVGIRLAALLAEGATVGPAVSWGWNRDAKGRPVAYVTIDATGTRQQGPGGKAAEGRMAYVAAVYNPLPVPGLLPTKPSQKQMQARYVSGLYGLHEVGPLLRRQAAAVGMEAAEVWVALSDGGAGLEESLRQNFNRPDVVVILDFYHAASYLEQLARALHPGDEGAAKQQAERWCRLLKEEGGAVTLAALENEAWPARRPAGLREQLEEVKGYFGSNLHRMEYPEYQREGWQIGSGVVESACKSVVGQRLKGPGMRWGAGGAHAVCHVRALYRSEDGQWDDFWKRRFSFLSNVHQPQ